MERQLVFYWKWPKFGRKFLLRPKIRLTAEISVTAEFRLLLSCILQLRHFGKNHLSVTHYNSWFQIFRNGHLSTSDGLISEKVEKCIEKVEIGSSQCHFSDMFTGPTGLVPEVHDCNLPVFLHRVKIMLSNLPIPSTKLTQSTSQ